MTAGYEYVGSSGTGSLTQSGGTNQIGSYLYLALKPGTSGTCTLSGSGWLFGPDGGTRSGRRSDLRQPGGTNQVLGTLYLGYNLGSSAGYSLSGSSRLTAG